MHWIVLTGAAVSMAVVCWLLWRWRGRRGRLGRSGMGLLVWAVATGLFAVVAMYGAHAWVPGAVDLGRGILGFSAMNDLERIVYTWLDRQGPPDNKNQKKDLTWIDASSCLEDGQIGAFQVARAAVDPTRPEVETTFIAMDLDRLSLDLLPGGVAPEDAVAAFNGGFQIAHGGFGMRAAGQTLVPPQEGLATLGVNGRGKVRLWTWSRGDTEGGWRAFRQNLAPLLDTARTPQVRGELALTADGRQQRVGHAPIRRSGLCMGEEERLVYVWSRRATAQTLGEAMRVAGCDLGMHLDANAFHTRFEFMGPGCTVLGAAEMTDGPRGRYRRSQKRDFFVVTLVP